MRRLPSSTSVQGCLGHSLAVAALFVAAAHADDAPVFPGESAALGRQLAELAHKEEAARKAASETQWAQLLDELLALSISNGNDLAALDAGQSIQVRRAVQARLIRFPPDVLRQYRARAEGQARKWLDEAAPARDVRLLRRIADEAFCTESARTALELLGDLAFEGGDGGEAEAWWGLLAAHHPGTSAAGAEARLLLVRWFAGERSDAWTASLGAFRRRHPAAEGHLAGVKGVYWKGLAAIAARGGSSPLAASHWPTFAGAASRNCILPDGSLTPENMSRLVRDGVSHRIELSREKIAQEVKTPGEFARSFAFCPAIAGGKVLVADAQFVTAIDPVTGKREVWCDAAQLADGIAPELALPAPADLRYTLTAGGDCVLARLGVQALRSGRKERELAREGGSLLVCLDTTPNAQGSRVRWRVAFDGKKNTAFEGTPVVGNGSAHVGVLRFEGNRIITAIHCYALEAKGTPPLKWKRDVCSARDLSAGEARQRHHLLTLAGPHIFCCTHSGAVIALDAVTGQQVWGMRYRQLRGAEDDTRPAPPRDLNPCIHAGGKLYIAPADSDLLLCLDPLTGNVLWERGPIEVQHLLGVGGGKLIFTTTTPTAGLRALNAADGGDRGGWFRTGAGRPVYSTGRGLLASDLVIWPTLHHLYIVRQVDGEQPDDPTLVKGIPSGNFAFGEGILAVADQQQLHIFAPPRVRLQAPAREPQSALDQFRLGTALADSGKPGLALDLFHQAAVRAGNGRLGGEPLRELAWDEEQRALFAAARLELEAGRLEQAASLVNATTGGNFPAAIRSQAHQRTAAFWIRAGEPVRAAAACLALFEDRELARIHVADERGLPQTARTWAVSCLTRLEREHGPELTPFLDRTLPGLPEKPDGDIPRLIAPKARALLLAYARKLEDEKRPGAAAEVLRLFLRHEKQETARAPALAQLARLYESQGISNAARLVSLTLPLLRSWSQRLASGERVLLAENHQPAAHVFTARAGTLVCRDAETGKQLWQCSLPLSPNWIGQHADMVLVGGKDGMACLTLAEGQLLWEYAAPESGRLSTYRLAAGRLYFLAGERRLFALDAETGMVLWVRRAVSSFLRSPDVPGRLTSYQPTTQAVLLPERREALDAGSGAFLRGLPAEEPGEIAVLDPDTGAERWSRSLSSPTTLSGEPVQRIAFGRDAHLFVVPRNQGTTLESYTSAGRNWSALLRHSAPLAGGISFDESACYLVHDGEASSFSLREGRRLWTKRFPGPQGRWRTARAGDWLVAWPIEPRRLAVPVPLSWPGLECKLAWHGEETLPILLLEARTGQLVQRLNVPAPVPRIELGQSGAGGGEETLAVVLTPKGLLVRAGAGVVHLAAMAEK